MTLLLKAWKGTKMQKGGSRMSGGLKQHREFERVAEGQGNCENGIGADFDAMVSGVWYEEWYRWTIMVWKDWRLKAGGQRGWGYYCVASFQGDRDDEDTVG